MPRHCQIITGKDASANNDTGIQLPHAYCSQLRTCNLQLLTELRTTNSKWQQLQLATAKRGNNIVTSSKQPCFQSPMLWLQHTQHCHSVPSTSERSRPHSGCTYAGSINAAPASVHCCHCRHKSAPSPSSSLWQLQLSRHLSAASGSPEHQALAPANSIVEGRKRYTAGGAKRNACTAALMLAASTPLLQASTAAAAAPGPHHSQQQPVVAEAQLPPSGALCCCTRGLSGRVGVAGGLPGAARLDLKVVQQPQEGSPTRARGTQRVEST